MNTALANELAELFPFLGDDDEELQAAFSTHAQRITVPAGQHICLQGQKCSNLALIVSGRARVYKMGEGGREVTLYRVGGGDSCVLSAACILSDYAFPAYAVTESEVQAVIIPAQVLRGWVNRFDAWRAHLFALLARRLGDIIEVLEEVTFRRVDARLATYLLAAADPGGVVSRTHSAIATDLGASREAVSRILKEFERGGSLSLARGAIRLLDLAALRRCAHKEL